MDGRYLLCKDCPRCIDKYPGKLDAFGNHFCICSLSGNMVYPEPRKEKRMTGSGYISFAPDTCGLYTSVSEALASMTPAAVRWYYERVGTPDIPSGYSSAEGTLTSVDTRTCAGSFETAGTLMSDEMDKDKDSEENIDARYGMDSSATVDSRALVDTLKSVDAYSGIGSIKCVGDVYNGTLPSVGTRASINSLVTAGVSTS